MKIRTKFIGTLCLFIVLLTALILEYTFYQHKHSTKGINNILNYQNEIELVSQLELALTRVIMPANDYLVHGDEEEREIFLELDAEVNRLFDILDGKHYHTRIMAEERELLSSLKGQYASVKDISEEIFHLPNPIGNAEGARLMEEMDLSVDSITEDIQAFHRNSRLTVLTEVEVISAYFDRHKIVMLSALAVIVTATIFYGLLLIRGLVIPIRRLIEYMDKVARGDFSHRLDIKTKDEMGALTERFNNMTEKLKASYDTINEYSKDLERMVEERTEKLRQIEWLLTRETTTKERHLLEPAYGDLTEINTCRLVLDSVGKDILTNIMSDYLDLLDTSSAVYEKNGHYALGIFTSGWCRFLDQTSRDRCGTVNNKEALESGKWHCHESCWRQTSLVSIEKGQPVDTECLGGIHLYAVPIRAGGEVVGSINFGYGNPPKDPGKLQEIAELYGTNADKLLEQSNAYEVRPPFIIDIAKERLLNSAKLIGEIIDRKLAENSLAESEERFRSISASAQDAIITVDNESSISYWNEASERIFGFSKEDAIGRPVHRLIVSERLREDALEGFKRFKDTGRGPLIGKTKEVTGLRKDGTEFPIEISLSAVKTKGKWNAIGILRDLTKRKQLEGQLMISYKMASLGRLTAGVVHEILNPLNIISAHTQLLLMTGEKGSKNEEDLKSIQEEIGRIVTITDGLLKFSRKGKLEADEVDSNSLLEKIISIVEPEMELSNIKFIREFEDGLPKIMANSDELRQVFLNLITNARDAMPEGGSLTISTQSIKKQGKPFISIEFTDTGIGIPKKSIGELFDPFFTTKTEDKGTGLGLSISYGIIRHHGGIINVKSKVGKGTTFIIDLPC